MSADPEAQSEMARLEQLLAAWRNGELSSQQSAELARLLSDSRMRSELVSEWLLDEAIYHTLRAETDLASQRTASQAQTMPSRARTRPGRSRRRGFGWLTWHEVRISLGWSLGMAVAACVALCGLYLYFQKAPAGQLAEARGGVLVQRADGTLAGPGESTLYPGDRVRVPAGGAAVLSWGGEPTRLELRENSEIEFGSRLRGKRLRLATGVIEAEVAPQPWWRPMILGTPQARIRVVGTHFTLTATPTLTRLDVFLGEVLLLKTHLAAGDSERSVTVRGGQTVSAAPALKLEVQYLRGLLSSDVWVVPPGTELAEAPAVGTAVAGNEPADPAHSVERLRGYLIAPENGDFVFWVGSFGGDQPVEFWMSPDESPANKRRLAYYTPGSNSGLAPGTVAAPATRGASRTLIGDWSREATQKSAPQPLVQGRRYYVELWHGGAGVHAIGLGWRRPTQAPNATPEAVDIQTLCPFVKTPGKHEE
jgi:FecR protein